jgi:hypothetical protein
LADKGAYDRSEWIAAGARLLRCDLHERSIADDEGRMNPGLIADLEHPFDAISRAGRAVV